MPQLSIILLTICAVILIAVVLMLLVVAVFSYRKWEHAGSIILGCLLALLLCFISIPSTSINQLHIRIVRGGGKEINFTNTSTMKEADSSLPEESGSSDNDNGKDDDRIRRPTDWRQCIIQMGNHMNVGTTEWIQPNPCGFESRISVESMRPVMFPSSMSNITVVHVGDSLAHRHYVHAINRYYPPHSLPNTYKLHRAPSRWALSTFDPPLLPPVPPSPLTTTTTSSSSSISIKNNGTNVQRRMSKLVFRKARHIHDTVKLILEEIADACTISSSIPSSSGGPLVPLGSDPATDSDVDADAVVEGKVYTADDKSPRQHDIPPPVHQQQPSGGGAPVNTTNPTKPPPNRHHSSKVVPNIIFMSFGSWDMTWKATAEVVPGLAPGVPYYNITMEQVEKFWASEVDRLFVGIDGELAKCRKRGGLPPFLVLREQYMSDCNTPRYSSPHDKVRQNCTGFITPILIPLQRRILAATAWSYNVPVIPSEHLFAPGSRCRLHDGLHMGNVTCMELEHQQYWETYSHMQFTNITQVRLPHPLNTSSFVNVKHFYEHLDLLGVGKYYRGQKYPVSYGRPTEGEEPSDP